MCMCGVCVCVCVCWRASVCALMCGVHVWRAFKIMAIRFWNITPWDVSKQTKPSKCGILLYSNHIVAVSTHCGMCYPHHLGRQIVKGEIKPKTSTIVSSAKLSYCNTTACWLHNGQNDATMLNMTSQCSMWRHPSNKQQATNKFKLC